MHYQQGGENLHPIHNNGEKCILWRVFASMGRKRWILSSGGTWVLHAFVHGSLHSYFGSSLCHLDLLCALLFCRWCWALLPHLKESTFWSILSRLCWVIAFVLGDRDLLFQVILCCLLFSFWSHVWVLCSFLFFFLYYMNWWLCVLSEGPIRRPERGGVNGSR
jgi:hypothetical protein